MVMTIVNVASGIDQKNSGHDMTLTPDQTSSSDIAQFSD